MKFDGNRAWGDAVRAISSNREVLLVMAGVFFFLPGLVAAFFLSGIQTEMQSSINAMIAAPRSPAAMEAMEHVYGEIAPYMLLLLVVESVGYMAMLALLTDQRRPTVGEAMVIGARCLPALIGAIILTFLSYVVASLPLGLILVGCMLALGNALGSAIGATIVFLLLFAAATRLSLTLPVIVIEAHHNPFAALVRSWRITRGNSLRLIAFYVLLIIAYLVITITLGAVLKLLTAPIGTGDVLDLIDGVLSALIGAVGSIVITAVLAAIHRQLAGASGQALSDTFN